jgi:pyruvate,water dikinase
MSEGKPIDKLIHDLQERAKELNCLYQVQELLNNPQLSLDQVCQGITEAIPPGWQYPELCCARITINKHLLHQTNNFLETPWKQSAEIVVSGERIGEIEVFYSADMPEEDEGPFLKEERKLINTISEQLGYYLLNHQLREVFEQQRQMEQDRKAEWWAILNMLRRTDPKLLVRISRKMISYLCSSGIKEAEQYLVYFSPAYTDSADLLEENRPYIPEEERDSLNIIDDVYNLASEHLEEDVMLEEIHQWIKEEQTDFLIQVLVSPGSTLEEISTAIERYHHLAPQGMVLSKHRDRSVRGGLIRRLLNDQPSYIETSLEYMTIEDINQLLKNTMFQIGSHGRLGGKGSGLVLANLILQKMHADGELPNEIKIPKTWYLVSDCIFKFIDLNGFEDFIDQKYKDLQLVRQEYPFIVHVFKNGTLPPEIIKGLSLALDDFGDVPLIVRSSSLLEDQQGLAFAGKYKSLFIPNLGNKDERLSALIDAISEVYASMFGPDPIGYRTAHRLLEHHEEMAIMIQEVVGSKNGNYFFPSCAGVAFSDIEIPWSSRIARSDGLIRLVPGLGTRAVDRTGDDYPILVAPGQPGLRTNVSLDETVRYSPKFMDVINLETGTFETVDAISLLTEMGASYPKAGNLLSEISQDRIKPISLPKLNRYDPKDLAVTFDGMFSKTQFLSQVHTILTRLKDVLGYPVDIEFACDGTDFYLLQCRSQSYDKGAEPAEIPDSVDKKDILFSSSRLVPNGRLENITHIVYVDPKEYYNLEDHQDLVSVGKAVGRLNEILPRKQFILIGPGRWGSRGEIKLGVRVTYSDICHTAMLVEIAEPHGPYKPDPSFGTHFFQDLVEAQIRYLALFPDDSEEVFNYEFFGSSKNQISSILPDFQHLSKVIKVIDISETHPGRCLQIFMNAFSKKALAVFQKVEE